MHEANFTEQIIKKILDELSSYPDAKPRAAKVLVGEMLHLVPESVQMHYRLLTQGTSLEEVPLELAEVPVKIRCNHCGKEGGVEDHHLLMCSDCGTMNVKLISGDEIWVDVIELEEEKAQKN